MQLQHISQRMRGETIKLIENWILEYGGLIEIERTITIQNFISFIAGELGCTHKKATEYISIVRSSISAKKRMDEWKRLNPEKT